MNDFVAGREGGDVVWERVDVCALGFCIMVGGIGVDW